MSCVSLYTVETTGLSASPWEGLISNLKTAEGMVMATWAVQKEHPTVIGIVVNWTSFDHEQSWSKSKSSQQICELLGSASSESIKHDLVVTPISPAPSLGAPTLEVCSWIHPISNLSPEREADLAEKFTHFAAGIESSPYSAGKTTGGWGQISFEHKGQNCKRFTALIGWKSVEDHAACKSTPAFRDNIHYVSKNNDVGVEMVHYEFTEFQPKM